MAAAKIPKPDELIAIRYEPPETPWMETPTVFRPGTWSYSGTAEEPDRPRPSEPAGLAALRRGLEAAGELEGDHPGGDAGAPGEVPVLPPLHGHLRPVRRLRGQVPLLHRLRRPEEHAGPAGRAAALRLPPLFHRIGKALRQAGGRPRPDRSTSSRSGSTTSTSAPSAAAAPSSAPTASTRRRSP